MIMLSLKYVYYTCSTFRNLVPTIIRRKVRATFHHPKARAEQPSCSVLILQMQHQIFPSPLFQRGMWYRATFLGICAQYVGGFDDGTLVPFAAVAAEAEAATVVMVESRTLATFFPELGREKKKERWERMFCMRNR